MNNGITSSFILKTLDFVQLVGVDPFAGVDPSIVDLATAAYAERPETRSQLVQGYSLEVAEKIPDGSLDFVFIDGDHSFEAVRDDVRVWERKVRPGGMISGHDLFDLLEVKNTLLSPSRVKF